VSVLPLLAHSNADDIVARRGGESISLARFLVDVGRVMAVLPPCRHVLNLCADRYRFAVGLAASMASQRVSLLPSTHTLETLRQMAAFAPDCHILTDADPGQYPLPAVVFPPADEAMPSAVCPAVPRLDARQHVAWVFTSGSTGLPVPHRKSWGRLVTSVRATAAALGIDPTRPPTLVGTVPPQHMFGFESTVLLAWLGGGAFDASRPFYPADIVATLGRVPDAVLVTTPFHLRTLLDADLPLPGLEFVLSATAPLPTELARRAEAAFQAPLFEIYGSTETGQVATRRSATSAAWTLTRDVRLSIRDGQGWIEGDDMDAPIALADVIDVVGERQFTLVGRNADIINIAGKRTSLDYLDRQLAAIDGVRDGAFHLPDGGRDDSHITRLAAFVVAPGLDAASLRAALRERIDPAFMPRPLILLDALPRNATGKLPYANREALLAAHRAQDRMDTPEDVRLPSRPGESRITIAANHPAFAGHFPGRPIVPGVVLLDEAAGALALALGLDEPCWHLGSVKFIRAVGPGANMYLKWQQSGASGAIAFTLADDDGVIASGSLTPGGAQTP
jgi:acyl-coenzyme A synthetase/AMP-(fatty) acid ligase